MHQNPLQLALRAEIQNLLGPMTLSSIAPQPENYAALSENSPSGLFAFLNNLGQTAAALTCRALNISSGEEVHFNYPDLLEKVGITLRNSEITSTENFQMISLKIHTEESKALFYFYFFSLLDPVLLTESYYETLIATLNRYQGKNFQSHMREAIAELCLDHPLIQQNFSLSTFFVDPDDPAYDHNFQIVVPKKPSKEEKVCFEEKEVLIKKEWMSYCRALLSIKKLLPTAIDGPLANEVKAYLTQKDLFYYDVALLKFITQRFDWLVFLMSWLDQYADLSSICPFRLFRLLTYSNNPHTGLWELNPIFNKSLKIFLIPFSTTEKGFSLFQKLACTPDFISTFFKNFSFSSENEMQYLWENTKLMHAINEGMHKLNINITAKLLYGVPMILSRALSYAHLPMVLSFLSKVRWEQIPSEKLKQILSDTLIARLMSSPTAQYLLFEQATLRPYLQEFIIRTNHPLKKKIFPGMADLTDINQFFAAAKNELSEFDASWSRYIYYLSDNMIHATLAFFFTAPKLNPSSLETRRQAIVKNLLSLPTPKQFDALFTRLLDPTRKLFLSHFLKQGSPIWQAETLDWLVDTLLKVTLPLDENLITLETLLITKFQPTSKKNDLGFIEKCLRWINRVRTENSNKKVLPRLMEILSTFTFQLAVNAIINDDKSIESMLKLPLLWTKVHGQQLLQSAIQHNRISISCNIVQHFKMEFYKTGLDISVVFFNPLLLESFLSASTDPLLCMTCRSMQLQFMHPYNQTSQACFRINDPAQNQCLIRSFEYLAKYGAPPLSSQEIQDLCEPGINILSLIAENECATLLRHYLLTELNWVKERSDPLELMEQLLMGRTFSDEISASAGVIGPSSFLKINLFTRTSDAHLALEQERRTQFLKNFYTPLLLTPLSDEKKWYQEYTDLLNIISTAAKKCDVSLKFDDFLEKIFPTLYTEHHARLKIRTLLETVVFKLQSASVNRQKYTFLYQDIALFNELNNAPVTSRPTSVPQSMIIKTEEESIIELKPFLKHFNRIICALERIISSLSNESLLYQMFEEEMEQIIEDLVPEENGNYLAIRAYLKQQGFAALGIKFDLSIDFLARKDLPRISHEYRLNFLQAVWKIWHERSLIRFDKYSSTLLNLKKIYEKGSCTLQDLYDLHIWLSLEDPQLAEGYSYEAFFSGSPNIPNPIKTELTYFSRLLSHELSEVECNALTAYLLNDLPGDGSFLIPSWSRKQDLPTYLNKWLQLQDFQTDKEISNIHLPRLFALCEAAREYWQQSIIKIVFAHTQRTFIKLLACPHHFSLLKKPDYFNVIWAVPELAKELISARNLINNPFSLEALCETDINGNHFLHTLCATLDNEPSQRILSEMNWEKLNPRIRLINALIIPNIFTLSHSALIDLFERPFGRRLLFKTPMLRKIAEFSLQLAFKIPFKPLLNLFPDIQIPEAEASLQMFTIFTVNEKSLSFAEWVCMPELDSSTLNELLSKILTCIKKEFFDTNCPIKLSEICHEFLPAMSPHFMRAIFDLLVTYKKNQPPSSSKEYALKSLWQHIRSLKDLEHVLNTLKEEQALEFLSGFIEEGPEFWNPLDLNWLLPYLERGFKYLKPAKLMPFLSYMEKYILEDEDEDSDDYFIEEDIPTLEKFILFLQKALRVHFISPLSIEEIWLMDLTSLLSTKNPLTSYKYAVLNLIQQALLLLEERINRGITDADPYKLQDTLYLSDEIVNLLVNDSALEAAIKESDNDALIIQFSIYKNREERVFHLDSTPYQPLPNKISYASIKRASKTNAASLSENALEIKPTKKIHSHLASLPLPVMDTTFMQIENDLHSSRTTPARLVVQEEASPKTCASLSSM